MKRSALAGLFITAAMLASPFSRPATPTCAKSTSTKSTTAKPSSPPNQGKERDRYSRVPSKAAHAAGDDKRCIEITSKALQDLQNSDKGNQ
jgi:hypothetical protein